MRVSRLKFIILFFTIFLTAHSYASPLYLKCNSLAAFGKPWTGNVSYVKIYPEKNEAIGIPANRALFQDTGESEPVWASYKITSINTEYINLKPCRDLNCLTDDVSIKLIDRVTGILRSKTKLDSGWLTTATWQCATTSSF